MIMCKKKICICVTCSVRFCKDHVVAVYILVILHFGIICRSILRYAAQNTEYNAIHNAMLTACLFFCFGESKLFTYPLISNAVAQDYLQSDVLCS